MTTWELIAVAVSLAVLLAGAWPGIVAVRRGRTNSAGRHWSDDIDEFRPRPQL